MKVLTAVLPEFNPYFNPKLINSVKIIVLIISNLHALYNVDERKWRIYVQSKEKRGMFVGGKTEIKKTLLVTTNKKSRLITLT